MENCIYRFKDEDENIIYVGKAKNLKNRLENHKHLPKECYSEQAYIEYTCFDNEYEMDFAERYYIQKLNPKYNTVLANKPISFSSKELDEKRFELYKLNEFVVEKTMEQMIIIKQEKSFINIDLSIVELVGLLNIAESKALKNMKNQKDTIKSYDYIYNMANKSLNKITGEYEESLINKYNLLDLTICYKDIDNINNYIDLENDEYTLEISYKEKYKKEYKHKDLIIKCKSI